MSTEMRLPKCVRVEHGEKFGEGRLVGTLVTFRGEIIQRTDAQVRPIMAYDCYSKLIQQIKWTGRLWRDEKIPDRTASNEMWNFIYGKTAWVIGEYPAAFAIFGDNRIALIGSHPVARGLNLCERIVRHVVVDVVEAGTYADNIAAIRFYKQLGMKETKREDVYHL